jgi:hypothetical protein
MRIGTKSVLFGVHCFLLHPLLIALGWWKAYGFRSVLIGERETDPFFDFTAPSHEPVFASLLSPRLWLAFVVHDLGYLGKPNMDGDEGEQHPRLGAAIMRFVCGEPWGDFVLLHSRYFAKRLNRDVSPLCLADKWVMVLEPAWLYLPRAIATGEVAEFMHQGQRRAEAGDEPYTFEEFCGFSSGYPVQWHRAAVSYTRRWIAEHSADSRDTWTVVRHGVAA